MGLHLLPLVVALPLTSAHTDVPRVTEVPAELRAARELDDFYQKHCAVAGFPILGSERVSDAAPREATVHFAMGKVLKRLGRPQQAMKCFLTAMDLDPKDNQLIKAAMDKLDEPDVEEEVATF